MYDIVAEMWTAYNEKNAHQEWPSPNKEDLAALKDVQQRLNAVIASMDGNLVARTAAHVAP
jgi:hypothetical protein